MTLIAVIHGKCNAIVESDKGKSQFEGICTMKGCIHGGMRAMVEEVEKRDSIIF